MIQYNSIVVGKGEVGSAILRILKKRKDKKAIGIDKKDKDYVKKLINFNCETLHICYPYSENFIKDTISYYKVFNPDLVIIHSTIAVGTTETLNKTIANIAHSPVRGQHPKIDKALLLFTKYIGTDNKKTFELAKAELSNMKVKWLNSSKDTELGKILDTTYYGVCIAWHREMEKICKHFNVNFKNAITDFNTTYNEGYSILRPNVVRPVLTPPNGKIGGHCVVQNAELLKKQKKSKFLDLIQ